MASAETVTEEESGEPTTSSFPDLTSVSPEKDLEPDNVNFPAPSFESTPLSPPLIVPLNNVSTLGETVKRLGPRLIVPAPSIEATDSLRLSSRVAPLLTSTDELDSRMLGAGDELGETVEDPSLKTPSATIVLPL